MKPAHDLNESKAVSSSRIHPSMSLEFISALSHELRTPMNGVMGMAELLSATELAPQQRNFLEEVQHSADALWKVIDDFLDFASLGENALRLKDGSVDVGQIAEDVVENLAMAAHRKLLEFMCYVSPKCPASIQGDQKRVQQVLESLVGTVIRLTRKGDVIVKVMPRGDGIEPSNIRFSVETNGALVSKSLYDRLFEPFSIEDDASIDKYHVTGLGLTVAKQLAELMGGELTVEYICEGGIILMFDLPMQTATAVKAHRINRTDLTGVRIIVVTENTNQCEIVSRQLSDFGALADGVADSERAMRQLSKASDAGQPYAMAVVERDMLQIDGLTFAHMLRDAPKICGTPVLLLDMVNQESDPEEYEGTGVIGCLTKPVTADELADTVSGAVTKCQSAERERQVSSVAASSDKPLKGAVLVAEDNRVNREIVVSMLRSFGCQCGVAENGQQALEVLESRHYDLILMDCQMPLMDGFEATRAIRLHEDLRQDKLHIPIVALTANTMDGDREQCLNVGMDDFIAKPFKKEQLLRTLERWLSRVGERP